MFLTGNKISVLFVSYKAIYKSLNELAWIKKHNYKKIMKVYLFV